jgi:hypothetical protein
MHSLMENTKITQVLGNQTSATSSKGSSVVDMQGYDGVVFIGSLSVGHATNNYIKGQQNTTSATATMADLVGTKIQSTASCLQLWLDIYRPRERFVRAVVIRGTASVIYPMWAIQYNGSKMPIDNTTAGTITGEVHVEPAEGTA